MVDKVLIEKINKIKELLPNVFTPAAPISNPHFLQGRKPLLDDIYQAFSRRGSSILLYGERGVGKTSIAKVALTIFKGNNFYYSSSGSDTFESISSAMLSHYGVGWAINSKEKSETSIKGAGIGIPIAKGELRYERTSVEKEIPLTSISISPQEVSLRLPKEPTIIIIDDFERIEESKSRREFADLIKKLSDNNVPTTLMIVGIGDNVEELITSHESIQRNMVEIKVPRLRNAEIRGIIDTGMIALDIEIEDSVSEQIVEFSANFPHYTHLLCEGAVYSLIKSIERNERDTFLISTEEVVDSILYAIKNTQHSISQAYESAVRNIRESPRFKYTLYAIASWPKEPVSYREICQWVGEVVKAPNGFVNVSHQLEVLAKAGILKKVSKGFYRFKNPILKAFVILKARIDTPENELATIDAQIKQVQKRLERLKERL